MAAVDFEKGDKTMAFLKSHRLPPSPQNYTLVATGRWYRRGEAKRSYRLVDRVVVSAREIV